MTFHKIPFVACDKFDTDCTSHILRDAVSKLQAVFFNGMKVDPFSVSHPFVCH